MRGAPGEGGMDAMVTRGPDASEPRPRYENEERIMRGGAKSANLPERGQVTGRGRASDGEQYHVPLEAVGFVPSLASHKLSLMLVCIQFKGERYSHNLPFVKCLVRGRK